MALNMMVLRETTKVPFDAYFLMTVTWKGGFSHSVPCRGFNLKSQIKFTESLDYVESYDYVECTQEEYELRVWGDGSDVRDLLHVEDMAEGIVFVAENVDQYDIYNVCYGKGFSVNEVLNILKELDSNDNPIEYVNNKAFMVSVRLLSSEKINKLGWKPKYELREALQNALSALACLIMPPI